MNKKNKKGGINKNMKIFFLIFSLALIFFSLLFDVFILVVDILPSKYLLILLLGTNFFVALNVCIMLKRKFKLWFKFIITFFSLIFILLFIIGCIYINKTYNFMGRIKSNGMITETYYIITTKDSSYNKISELDSKEIGTYNENVEIYDKAISELNKKINVNLKEYDSIFEMTDSLLDEEVDVVMISAYHKNSISEVRDDFDDKIKIIDTIEVKVKKETEETVNVDVRNETFTVYVSGIDQYGDISTRSRSDVNMLVTVNPKNHEVLLTSIPRDYYVRLHNTTGYKDKLTHAGIYGIDMSIKTIEDFLNVNIDYYVRVNFSTLVDVVDVIGGIDVYSDLTFVPWTDRSFVIYEGVNHMNGPMALAFARERYSYKEGDRHRVQNQQDVIAAIIKKVTSSSTILTKYTKLLDELSKSFETNIDFNSIKPLIKYQIDKMPSWTIKSYSLNGSDAYDYTYSAGMQELYVMIPDESTITKGRDYINGMESGLSFSELGIN